jgi:hypothetical protein
MKHLTDKQKKIYLENPDICPNCHSEELEQEGKWEDVLCIYEEWSCLDCKKWWVETYRLSDVEFSGEF